MFLLSFMVFLLPMLLQCTLYITAVIYLYHTSIYKIVSMLYTLCVYLYRYVYVVYTLPVLLLLFPFYVYYLSIIVYLYIITYVITFPFTFLNNVTCFIYFYDKNINSLCFLCNS